MSQDVLKVFVVMPSGNYRGGAEEALLHLVRHYDRARLRLHVALLENGNLSKRITDERVPCTVIEAGRLRNPILFARTVWRLATEIRRSGSDVVLGWMTKAHIYGRLAASLARVPSVYFQMGLPDGGIVDRMARAIPASGALACSSFAAQEQALVVRHPVIGVPLAADLDRFNIAVSASALDAKKRLGFDPERLLVGIVGRLQYWKGVHTFLDAIAAVVNRSSNVEAVVVGGKHDLEPDYPSFLQRRLQELNLQGKVHMVGTQINVPEWMQAMDIIVHASDREPFGIVVVEAMAMGKPVIASVPGGPTEIVEHRKSGLLVRSGDSSALAECIQQLIDSPSLRRSLGSEAAVRAQQFSPEMFSRRVAVGVQKLLHSEERCSSLGA